MEMFQIMITTQVVEQLLGKSRQSWIALSRANDACVFVKVKEGTEERYREGER